MKRVLACVFILCLVCAGAEAAVVDGPVRLGILKFTARAEGVDETNAAGIGDLFTRMLASSKTITVVERDQFDAIAQEQNRIVSGVLDDSTAAQLGKIAMCNYVLIGSVTRYEETNKVTDLWMFRNRKYHALVTLDARIVDVETTKVVLSLSETGTTTQKGSAFNWWGTDYSTNMDFKGMKAGAIADAASRLGYNLREALTGEHIEVSKLNGNEVIINLGTRNGAQLGGMFRVYVDGEEIFDSNGKSLGREMHDIAVIKITKLQPEFSNAMLAAKNAGKLSNIRIGDKLFPVNKEEMDAMIANKSFMDSRPRTRKSSREILRGDN